MPAPSITSRPAVAAALARVAVAEECQADAMARLDAARRIYEGTRSAVAIAREALSAAVDKAIAPADADEPPSAEG